MFHALEKLNQLFLGITKKLTLLGCMALLAMAVFISIDVLLRKLFAFSTQGTDELSGYLLAYVSVIGAIYALACKAHIRIEFLYVKLRSTVQRLLDISSILILTTFIGILTYYAYRVWDRSVTREALANTPLHTPLWIPQGIWLVCLLFFCLVLALYTVYALYCLFTHRHNEIQRLFGCPELDENIMEESGIDIREASQASSETKAR